MSIATEITRLQGIKADIKDALAEKGVDAQTHNMADFPNDILSIQGSDIKPYEVRFQCDSGFIGQTLSMKQEGHDTVRGIVGTDGTLTLYPLFSGIWECSCYSTIVEDAVVNDIELTYWGVQPTVMFNSVPKGTTVEPINNVQLWLNCANVYDKPYSTIAEVVADDTTLNAVINNENATDYLIRSVGFSVDITSNSNAMMYIGLNDYCAKKLIVNAEWLDAICSSSYFESVLNTKVPTMTSNTEPEGIVTSDSIDLDGNRYLPYVVFDGKVKNWSSTFGFRGTKADNYIGYEFNKYINVKYFFYVPRHDNARTQTPKNLTLQYYDEISSNWINAANTFVQTNTYSTRTEIYIKGNASCDVYAKKWRVKLDGTMNNGAITCVNEMQLFGREL